MTAATRVRVTGIRAHAFHGVYDESTMPRITASEATQSHALSVAAAFSVSESSRRALTR